MQRTLIQFLSQLQQIPSQPQQTSHPQQFPLHMRTGHTSQSHLQSHLQSPIGVGVGGNPQKGCLLYTSDAADEG